VLLFMVMSLMFVMRSCLCMVLCVVLCPLLFMLLGVVLSHCLLMLVYRVSVML